MPTASSWGRHDVSAKILGTYERHVTDRLVGCANPNGVLLDLGSADGYFAVGALRAGLFSRAICFERSQKGRAALRAAATQNGVAERIEIKGDATEAAILAAVPKDAVGVALCDIEGGEFHVLTDAVLQHLATLHVIIELHDFLVEDGAAKKAALIDRAATHFTTEIMVTGATPISEFPELDRFDDDRRLLAFSEGREAATDWLVLHPKPSRSPA